MRPSGEIRAIFDAVTQLSGAGICLYDLRDFFYYDNVIDKKSYAGHYCKFCRQVRSYPSGKAQCEKSDVENAVKLAKLYKKPFFNICYLGLCEYVVPVLENDELIAVAFLGQCRIRGENDFSSFSALLRDAGFESEQFRDSFNALPELERESHISGGRLLDIALASVVRDNIALKSSSEADMSISEKIMSYIKTSYMTQISSADIADRLHVNRCYLSRVFKRETGITIGDYICRVRVENAKELLCRTMIPVSSISFNVGFCDQNYFSRVFKRCTGYTPGEFRRDKYMGG